MMGQIEMSKAVDRTRIMGVHLWPLSIAPEINGLIDQNSVLPPKDEF